MIMITSDDVFEKKHVFFTHLSANGNAIYAPL